MATKTAKTTTKTTAKPAAKAPKAKAAKKPVATQASRAPKALLAKLGTKESVVGSLIGSLAIGGEDTDALRARLLRVSNSKLLRLHSVVDTVNKKFGGRAKLIEKIAGAKKASKDKDYIAKLGTLPLPRLLDMARIAK